MKLIMMRGLPASGKSTKAKELIEEYGNFVRVSRDPLRLMLHYGKWSGKHEGITVDVEMATVRHLLKKGNNVIVDDTNFGESNETRWKGIANECEAKFEIVGMDTSWEVCVQRDAEREAKVGKSVIVGMAMANGLFENRPLVVCDIDGTLADIKHRLHFVRDLPEGVKKDWKSFFAGIPGDTLREDIRDLLNKALEGFGKRLILVSARPEDHMEATEEWLAKNGIVYDCLLMRKKGDKRPDTEVKADIYERYLKPYSVEVVFDDRPVVIEMWRQKGLNVIDVGEGVDF